MATAVGPAPTTVSRPDLDQPTRLLSLMICVVLGSGIAYIGYQLVGAWRERKSQSWLPFLLLFVALLVAFAFEFINGFHDTANAVTTVIYTHTMPAPGGALLRLLQLPRGAAPAAPSRSASSTCCRSTDHQVARRGLGHGVRASVAGVIWNLGTWYLGLPVSARTPSSAPSSASASRTPVHRRTEPRGELGQGRRSGRGAAAVAADRVLLAALLLLVMKLVIREPALYEAPEGDDRRRGGSAAC